VIHVVLMLNAGQLVRLQHVYVLRVLLERHQLVAQNAQLILSVPIHLLALTQSAGTLAQDLADKMLSAL